MFIPPLPKQFCTVNIKCRVTYFRWLPGQIAADVPHPDISEGSLRLAFAAAPLPSPPPRLHVGHVQPSSCSYSTQALMLHFWWVGITFLFFQLTPQSCPRHSGLTSLQSFPLFNLFKKKNQLFCCAGREVHPSGAQTYHAIHVMVMQLKKCLVLCKSQRSHIFSIIHDIFKLLNKILSFSLSHCVLCFFLPTQIYGT